MYGLNKYLISWSKRDSQSGRALLYPLQRVRRDYIHNDPDKPLGGDHAKDVQVEWRLYQLCMIDHIRGQKHPHHMGPALVGLGTRLPLLPSALSVVARPTASYRRDRRAQLWPSRQYRGQQCVIECHAQEDSQDHDGMECT